jgi:hypothetical protein
LTRYHGVFAPHAALRAAITPAGRGQGARRRETAAERCRRCGGRLKVIASIEEPALIERILAHLERRPEDEHTHSPFTPRAPPQPSLF